MKRKLASATFALFAWVFIALIFVSLLIFFKPGLFLSAKNLNLLLEKTNVLEEWSWASATIEHEWEAWNKRIFRGDFQNFCFRYDKNDREASGCLEELSWDFKLVYNFGEGLSVESLAPLKLKAETLRLKLPEDEAGPVKQAQEERAPPEIKKWWDLFWGDKTPDMDIEVGRLEIQRGEGDPQVFDVNLNKSGANLNAESRGFILEATPKGARLKAPEKIELPFDPPMLGPLNIEGLEVRADMLKDSVKVNASAFVYGVELKARSELGLPLKHPPGSSGFLRALFLKSQVYAKLENVKEKLENNLRGRVSSLPAPLNALNGKIELLASALPGTNRREVELVVKALADMEGKTQELDFDLIYRTALELEPFSAGPMFFDLVLNEVTIQLPRLPKKSLPPRFIPDGRIHQSSAAFEREIELDDEKKKPLNLNARLKAKGEKALGLRTNLLDEILRLNFDLLVEQGKIRDGKLKALPLRTEFFKRDIELKKFLVSYEDGVPLLDAQILFDLPEYDVTLFLEGPLSSPKHYLESEPALPEEDIYAVLLFGRPMIDLSGSEKNAAEKTNQVLSQGILSLGVLYFLSGTPIQAVIYDPDTDSVSAQFAIDEKRSLTVGQGSVGVRQSLGGGWYIDTGTRQEEGYGVMLERVKAY